MKKIFNLLSVFGLILFADNEAVSAYFTGNFLSLHEFNQEPQVRMKLYRQLGGGYLMTNFLRMIENEFSFAGDDMFAITKYPIIDNVKVTTPQTGGATPGAAMTFRVHADSLDSNGNVVVRVKDSVIIPLPGGEWARCWVTVVNKTSVTQVDVTIQPFDSTVTIGTITDGIELGIFDSAHGDGTGPAGSKVSGYFKTTYYKQILKEFIGAHGSEIARALYTNLMVEGSFWSELIGEAELRQDLQIEGMFWTGETNQNSLTDTADDGEIVDLYSTEGIITRAKRLVGGSYHLNYNDADGWTKSKWDEIGDYGRSQTIQSKIWKLCVGHGLLGSIEDSGVDTVQFEDARTIFRSEFGEAADGVFDTLINYGVSFVKSKNILYVVSEIETWGNPLQYGNTDLVFKDMGLAIPLYDWKGTAGDVDGRKDNIVLPNVSLGYRAYGEANRKRVIVETNGTTGYRGLSIPVNHIDAIKHSIQDERLVFWAEPNKAVLIEKEV